MNKAFATLLVLSIMVCSIAAQAEDQPISFKGRVLSLAIDPNAPYTEGPVVARIVALQSAIWVAVGLAVVLFFTLQAMLNMDANKEQDTILYAKFLANVN
jgi:hypothetical protein